MENCKENTLSLDMQPIIFQNKPIDSEEKDLFDFSYQKKVLNVAIDSNARIIGIIGDYGTGKSSITKLLEIERKKKKDGVIGINLWDQLKKVTYEKYEVENKEIEKEDVENQSLMKSFLYQLAFANKKRNASFARYINARFNKNNGKIGFAFATRKTYIIVGIAAIFFILYLTIGLFVGNEPSSFLSCLLRNGTFKNLSKLNKFIWIVYSIRYLLLSVGIGVLIWAIVVASPVFSTWKSEGNYVPESSDLYEIYLRIIKRITPFCKKRKCIIFIDDLDRTSDKLVVVSFLKEIYKCVHLLPEQFQKQIVFIISLKAESMLQLEEMPEDLGNVYSKIFDYTLNIKQIHSENYRDIVAELLEQEKKSISTLFRKNDMGKEDILSSILTELKWIYNDENVTIRELKERLNETFLLYQTLRNRNYENSSVQLKKCAAVTFLKRKYEKKYNEILTHEKDFAKLIRTCNKLDSRDENLANNINTEIVNCKFMGDSPDVAILLKEMIRERDIEDDFSMYLYSYPKRSYIKTFAEKEVFDAIVRDDVSFLQKENCNDEIKEVIEEKEAKVIMEAFSKYLQQSVPSIVYRNEMLFSYIIKNFENQRKIIFEEINEKITSFVAEQNPLSAIYIQNSLSFNYRNDIKTDLIDKINQAIISHLRLSKPEIVERFRTKLLEVSPKNLFDLVHIFTDETLPLFSKNFFENIDNENFKEVIIKCLSEKRLIEFDKMGIISIKNGNIEAYLYENKMIISLLLSYSIQDRLHDFNFSSNWICNKLLEVASDLYALSNEDFIKIRTVAQKYIEHNSENFYKLYYTNYPLITKQELYDFSASDLYLFINHSLVTSDNCNLLSEFCNDKKLHSHELYDFFCSLFMKEEKITSADIMKKIFEGINFANIKFNSLSDEQQKEIVLLFNDTYTLSTVSGAFKFMRITKCLLEVFERQFKDKIKNDTGIYNEYIDLLNELECATEATLDIIKDGPIKVALHPNITDILFKKKYYIRYIIGKTLYDKKLTFNATIPLEKYYKVFVTSQECSEYFNQNIEVIDAFYNDRKYTEDDFPAEKLYIFYKKRQPFELIKVILTKWNGNEEKQKEYLLQITDIDTEYAAYQFIDLITQSQFVNLLTDSSLFYYLWHKMWNPAQKGLFTRKVNKCLKTTYNSLSAY